MKIEFPEKLIIAHLNINSIRNKFGSFSFMIENNVDILLISETKLDDSFPLGQFNICQKQPSRIVLRKRCSENMQQVYRRAPMPKCDFNKVAKQ